MTKKIERMLRWLEQVDPNGLSWGPWFGDDVAYLLAASIRANMTAAGELIDRGAKQHPQCTERDCILPVCQINNTLKEAHRLAKWLFG